MRLRRNAWQKLRSLLVKIESRWFCCVLLATGAQDIYLLPIWGLPPLGNATLSNWRPHCVFFQLSQIPHSTEPLANCLTSFANVSWLYGDQSHGWDSANDIPKDSFSTNATLFGLVLCPPPVGFWSLTLLDMPAGSRGRGCNVIKYPVNSFLWCGSNLIG